MLMYVIFKGTIILNFNQVMCGLVVAVIFSGMGGCASVLAGCKTYTHRNSSL